MGWGKNPGRPLDPPIRGPDKGMQTVAAMEITRLQAEVARLTRIETVYQRQASYIDYLTNQHNEIILKLITTLRWAKAWKAAAKISRQVINDLTGRTG